MALKNLQGFNLSKQVFCVSEWTGSARDLIKQKATAPLSWNGDEGLLMHL